MVQAVLASRPMRGLATREMLAGHPPAGHFARFARIANVVNYEDVFDIARHFRRGISVARVHIETMAADAAGLPVGNDLWPARIGYVIDFEAAVFVGALAGLLEITQVG